MYVIDISYRLDHIVAQEFRVVVMYEVQICLLNFNIMVIPVFAFRSISEFQTYCQTLNLFKLSASVEMTQLLACEGFTLWSLCNDSVMLYTDFSLTASLNFLNCVSTVLFYVRKSCPLSYHFLQPIVLAYYCAAHLLFCILKSPNLISTRR